MPIRTNREAIENVHRDGKLERVYRGSELVHLAPDAPAPILAPLLALRVTVIYGFSFNITWQGGYPGLNAYYEIEWYTGAVLNEDSFIESDNLRARGTADRAFASNYNLRQLQPNTTYTARVRTVSVTGGGKGPWAQLTATTLMSPTAPGKKPGSVRGFFATAGETTVRATWLRQLEGTNDDFVPVQYYRLTLGSEEARVFGQEVRLFAGTRGYTFQNLLNSTQYTVSIRAGNENGEGPSSSQTVITQAAPAGAPGPVQNVEATNVIASEGQAAEARVSWNAPAVADGVGLPTTYQVQWATDAGFSNSFGISTVASSVTRHALSSTPVPGATLHVRVRSVNSVGESIWQSDLTIVPGGGALEKPVAPTGLSFTTSSNRIEASWDAVEDARSYLLQIGRPNTQGQVVYGSDRTTSGLTASYTGLAKTTLYYFRLRAENLAGDGPWVFGRATTTDAVPNAPTNLQFTIEGTSVTMAWAAPSGGGAVDEYRVQWGTVTNGVATYTLGDDTTSNRSYNVTGLTANTQYAFRVRAENDEGESSWLGKLATTLVTANPPGPVRGVRVETTSSSATLTWNLPATGGAPTSYDVRYGTGSDTTANPYEPETTTDREILLIGLSASTSYGYRIRAINADGRSGWVEGSFTTEAAPLVVPGMVRNLAAIGASQNTIRATWDPPDVTLDFGLADTYCIEWSEDTSFANQQFVGFATSYIITGLTAQTTYNVRVVAMNTAGAGEPSDSVEGATTDCTLAVAVLTPNPIDVGADFSFALPAARNSTGTVTYTVSGLPDGLAYTASNRTVSGAPTVAGAHTITYAAEDGNGCMASTTFVITVNCILSLPAVPSRIFPSGVNSTFVLPEAENITGNAVYAITETLPGGLSFVAGTRTLSGTPTTGGKRSFTYTVTDDSGCSASATFMITTCIIQLADIADIDGDIGTALSVVLPSATNTTGSVIYVLTGALAAGVDFDASTRTVSGTPTAVVSSALVLTATDSTGCVASKSFRMEVSAPALQLTGPISWERLRNGTSFTYTMPDISNKTTAQGAQYTYRVENLPKGLSFNATTRTISGTLAEANADLPVEKDVQYIVVESAGPPFGTRSLTVTTPMFVLVQCFLSLPNVPDIDVALDGNTLEVAPDVTFDTASGGSGNYAYSIVGILPLQYTFDSNPGAPTLNAVSSLGISPPGTYPLSLRVEDTETLCVTAQRFAIVIYDLCDYIFRDVPDETEVTGLFFDINLKRLAVEATSAQWTPSSLDYSERDEERRPVISNLIEVSLDGVDDAEIVYISERVTGQLRTGQLASAGLVIGTIQQRYILEHGSFSPAEIDDNFAGGVLVGGLSWDANISFTYTNIGFSQPSQTEQQTVVDETYSPLTVEITVLYRIRATLPGGRVCTSGVKTVITTIEPKLIPIGTGT